MVFRPSALSPEQVLIRQARRLDGDETNGASIGQLSTVKIDAKTLIGARYQLGEQLGQGGHGSVYRARDLRSDRTVAIKFLSAEPGEDQRQILRFRREFRAVSRLDHPGCLRVFEEGVYDQVGQRYIVMEYVDGGDLTRLSGADAKLLCAVLIKLCGALEYIHSRYIVHRDLKPANVLLTRDDPPSPKLADFGIAKVYADSITQLSNQGSIIGTLDYMSPEQASGRPVDPRSDLYSLGCLIYRLFSGRAPFASGSYYERLMARILDTPPLLRTVAPNVPPEIEALCEKLLAVDPNARLQSAFAVGQNLSALLAKRGGAADFPSIFCGEQRGGFLYQPGFYGRQAVLDALAEDINKSLRGSDSPGSLWLVSADAGMGKHALCRALIRELSSTHKNLETLTLEALSPAPAPLFPLSELVSQPLTRTQEDRGLSDAVAPLHQLAQSITTELLNRNKTSPLLLIVHDFHRADASTWVLLGEISACLARSTRNQSCPVILVTLRPRSLDGGNLPALEGPWIRRIQLGALEESSVRSMIGAMLGVGERFLPPHLFESVFARSHGCPQLVRTTLQAMLKAGQLVRKDDGWVFVDDALALSEDPRLSGLSSATRKLLSLASACGQRFDSELLIRAGFLEADQVLDAIDEALGHGVIHSLSGDQANAGRLDLYEFEHEDLVQILYREMSSADRRNSHRAIANILKDRGTRAVILSYHLAQVGDPQLAYDSFCAAAAEAKEGHDLDSAQRYLRSALLLVSGLPDAVQIPARAQATEELADVLVALGEAGEACELLGTLLREQTVMHAPIGARVPSRVEPTPAEVIRGRRLRKLGLGRLRLGDPEAARTTLEQSLSALLIQQPKSRSRLYLQVFWNVVLVLWFLLVRRVSSLGRASQGPGLLAEGKQERPGSAALLEQTLVHRDLALLYRWVDDVRSAGHHFAFARAAQRLLAPDLMVEAYAAISMFLGFSALPALGTFVESQARRLALSMGDRVGLARIAILRGAADIFLRNDPAAGLMRMDLGIVSIRESGDRVLYSWAMSFRGWASLMAGRFGQAQKDFSESLQISESLRLNWLWMDASCGRAMAEMGLGCFAQAEAAVSNIFKSPTLPAMPALAGAANEVRGGVAFSRGDYRQAVAYFSEAYQINHKHHLDRGWGFLVNVSLMESLILLADQEGAAAVPELLSKIKEQVRLAKRRMGSLRIYLGAPLVLEGVLASRRGQKQKALRLFAKALALRPKERLTYMDTWMLWRIVFERKRLSQPASEIQPLISELEQATEQLGLVGVAMWFSQARRIYSV